jgi:2-(1,2-epoxy-1,2-dihydrophenyl)acetyl-CoA isomerase
MPASIVPAMSAPHTGVDPATYETLLVDRADAVATVTLNRPRRKNAANITMWDELGGVLTGLARADDVRVVVVTGAEGEFCSGADLADDGEMKRHQLAQMRIVGDVCLALHRMPKPTIAKVDGVAAGAGMNLALACDLVVASDRARFSEIFARRGLSVDFGGSWLLPRLIGVHKAKELVLLADIIDAREASEYGFVNRVVPVAELDAFVADWAARLAAGPPIALSLSKRLLDSSFNATLEQALDDEGRAQTINFSTRDTVEAITAFIQKRPPEFHGR